MFISAISLIIALNLPIKEEYKCIRWSWSGDVYNRKVVCLEWKRKDKK